MNIPEILETFYSEHEWLITGEDYESLSWGENNSISKPSLEELQEKWDNDRAPIDNNVTQKVRQEKILSAWPIEKQFEAITEYHMDRPEKLNELLDHIQKVKEDNPKAS